MDFFSDLGKKITDGANSAIQKGQNFAAANQATSAAKECERKMTELYSEIGKLYVQANPDEAQANYPAIMDQIKQLEADFLKYKEEARTIKNQTLCTSCGAEVSKTAAFCPNCGAKIVIVEPTSAPETEPAFCGNCGAKIEPGTKFCGGCGTKVE